MWLAALLPLLAAGCCAGYHNHSGQAASCEAGPGWYETPLCFGFYSTCWRPWPEECPSCPSFALPQAAEQVLPGPAAPAPAQPMAPMPELTPPQPMPQPSPPMPPAAPPMPMPEPAQPPAGAAYELPPGDEAFLRRRWVEGGFVAQPASANLPVELPSP